MKRSERIKEIINTHEKIKLAHIQVFPGPGHPRNIEIIDEWLQQGIHADIPFLLSEVRRLRGALTRLRDWYVSLHL